MEDRHGISLQLLQGLAGSSLPVFLCNGKEIVWSNAVAEGLDAVALGLCPELFAGLSAAGMSSKFETADANWNVNLSPCEAGLILLLLTPKAKASQAATQGIALREEAGKLFQDLRGCINNMKSLSELLRRTSLNAEQKEVAELMAAAADKSVELLAELKPRQGAGQKPAGSYKLKVLIVEDNEINAVMLKRFIEKKGHATEHAEDGRQALEKLKAGTFDIVLMDLEMPVMHGLEASRLIRAGAAGEACRNLPIVAVTAYPEKEFRSLCNEVGIGYYLNKPVNLAELAAILRELFGKDELSPKAQDCPPQQPSEPRVDYKLALMRLGNDRNILDELIEVFLEDIEPRKAALKRLITEEDFHNSRIQAHSLKGASATVGALKLCAIAKKLEESCKQADKEQSLSLLEEILSELDETSTILLQQLRK